MDFSIKLEWLVSSLLVVVGLGAGLWQYLEGRHQQVLSDLHGDKAAVAAVAMRVSNGRFPRWHRRWPPGLMRRSTRHRCELFEALCLAAVYQRSGRSRSLIYGALAHAGETVEYRREIRRTVDGISMVVSRSWAYTDLRAARQRLVALRAALGLDPDVRLRLDSFQLDTGIAQRYWLHDPRLNHPAFDWAALKDAVDYHGSLVLVGPPEGSRVVIALDYHRAARGSEPERQALTSLGRSVVTAKYGKTGDPAETARARVADALADVIDRLPAYRAATCIAGVPGRKHDLSDKLAEAVAKQAGKTFVSMSQAADDAVKETPRFTVDSVDKVTGTVVLVDDVYRSGRTLQAAAAVLHTAGAEDVLGLTATCTISAAVLSCAHDCCMTTILGEDGSRDRGDGEPQPD